MSLWALVPVKSRHLAKGRLSPVLSPRQRRELTETMLRALLRRLSEVRGLDGVALVTSDAWELASGPRLIAYPSGDLNAASAHGAQVLAEAGATALLVLPADIPCAGTAEIERLLTVGRECPVVVVPDRHGRGTNALYLRPPTCLAPAFGPDSFRRHLRLAASLGLEARSLPLPGIGFDIDTPTDLARLRARSEAHGGGAPLDTRADAQVAVR